MIMRGDKIDTRRGLLWGAGGFIAFVLAPSLGLPPELPGMVASDILARQSWWISTAVASIVGLWLLVFSKKMQYKILAVVIALTPHLVGAPHPEILSSNGVPPELAAQFVTVSIAVGGLFWALIGGFSGYFYERLERSDN
jgi:cobalt transporter subunit CbtA